MQLAATLAAALVYLNDPVCRYAVPRGLCHAEGSLVLGCDLPAEDRKRALEER
jgi:hypothetical protein